jgi:hypothetical protein
VLRSEDERAVQALPLLARALLDRLATAVTADQVHERVDRSELLGPAADRALVDHVHGVQLRGHAERLQPFPVAAAKDELDAGCGQYSDYRGT